MSSDFDSMTAEALAEHFAGERLRQNGDRSAASRVRHGVRRLLDQIEGAAGESWQHRWIAADGDRLIRQALDRRGKASKRERMATNAGIAVLVGAGVVRPSLPLMLEPPIARLALRGMPSTHLADVEQVVAAAGSDFRISEDVRRTIRFACAAMIVFTGRPLAQTTAAEWGVAHRQRREVVAAQRSAHLARAEALPGDPPFRTALVSLNAAYTAASKAGLVLPTPNPPVGHSPLPPTLDRAAAAPLTVDAVLDRLGSSLPPRVRALVQDAYRLEGGGLDYSTIRRGVCNLNSYFSYVHRVLPGHDSLDIPISARADVLRAVRTTPADRRKPGTQRTSVAQLLGTVRSIYDRCDAVVERHGLTEHLPATGAFPWPRHVLAKISEVERDRRRTRLYQSVREHLGHLDGLVEAAQERLAHLDGLAAAAHAAPPGERFEYAGEWWSTAKATATGGHHGKGKKPVVVLRPDRDCDKFSVNIDEMVLRAAKARTLTVLLRETGLRIEEVAELAVDNLAPRAIGDFTMPVINVNPSKQERARTLGLAVPALEALHDLVTRSRRLYGSHPLVRRTDEYEGVDQPEARLIFFIRHHGQFVGPSRQALATWLNDVVDYYNEHSQPVVPLEPVRPHQMRRLFATDLHERGADIVTIQKTLGHVSVQTTSIYVHADEADAITAVIAARRRAKALASDNQCACCHGLGYRSPDAPHAG